MIKLAPSILSADFANLERDINEVSRAGAHYLHIDVMDGIFVPNITIGPPVIKSLRTVSEMIFDVHLMIDRPERFIRHFYEAGADIINIHAEACEDLCKTVSQIKKLGVKAGVTVKPETDIDVLLPVLNCIDLALIMTVEPGFGGQSIIMETFKKVKKLRNIINGSGSSVEIEIDGGVCLDNFNSALEAGANVIVAGSAVFNENGAAANVRGFLEGFKRFENCVRNCD